MYLASEIRVGKHIQIISDDVDDDLDMELVKPIILLIWIKS